MIASAYFECHLDHICKTSHQTYQSCIESGGPIVVVLYSCANFCDTGSAFANNNSVTLSSETDSLMTVAVLLFGQLNKNYVLRRNLILTEAIPAKPAPTMRKDPGVSGSTKVEDDAYSLILLDFVTLSGGSCLKGDL